MSALRQREPRYENRGLLDLCYLVPCTADWEHDCLHKSEPSHSNASRHGKAGAKKSHDCLVRAAPRRRSAKTGHANGESTRTPDKCRIGALR